MGGLSALVFGGGGKLAHNHVDRKRRPTYSSGMRMAFSGRLTRSLLVALILAGPFCCRIVGISGAGVRSCCHPGFTDADDQPDDDPPPCCQRCARPSRTPVPAPRSPQPPPCHCPEDPFCQCLSAGAVIQKPTVDVVAESIIPNVTGAADHGTPVLIWSAPVAWADTPCPAAHPPSGKANLGRIARCLHQSFLC